MGEKAEKKIPESNDRVPKAYAVTRKALSVDPEDIRKIEAVVYVMADKFLDSMDMEEILEGIRMTKLGQMLVNAGKAEGEAIGEARGEARGEMIGQSKEKLANARSLIDLLDEHVIAERLGLPLETVQQLKEEHKKHDKE